MVRVVLLLLIVAGLVTFAIQNLAPVALVVLGTRTLALPLAVWVLGALAAGAFTTLLLSGFFSLSKAGAVRRAAQRLSDSDSGFPRSPWGGVGTKRGVAEANRTQNKNTVGFRAASSERRSEEQSRPTDDDWETASVDRDTWDEWGEPPPRRTPSSTSRTNIRDTVDDEWRRWDDDRPADAPPRRSESRTEFTKRPPGDRYQEGRADGSERPPERSGGVYDAEYRVLVPPYSSQPIPPTPPSAPPKPAPSEPDPLDDDDDWGFDDLEPKK